MYDIIENVNGNTMTNEMKVLKNNTKKKNHKLKANIRAFDGRLF